MRHNNASYIKKTKKDNHPQAKHIYRPVSVIPVVSKIFERQMQKQTNTCATLQRTKCINQINWSWKQSLNQKDYSRAVLVDLSKAFDTLNLHLWREKLSATNS